MSFLAGLFIGAAVGYFICALLTVGAWEERHER